MKINLESTFELMSRDEWGRYLNVDLFDGMSIDSSALNNPDDIFQSAKFSRLEEMITEHNNKVGSLRITYALCKHYYEKGIPDDPWYISPGKNGESIQYMPNFSEEHWGRQYWFNFFTSPFYLRMSALWDSVFEIMNFFYDYRVENKAGFKNKVLEHLKINNPDLAKIIEDAHSNEIYIAANIYRNKAAHGNFAGEVHDTINVQIVEEKEVLVKDEHGITKSKKIPEKIAVSYGVGEYISSETIMNNINNYSRLTGEKIQEIIAIMTAV